MSKKTDYTSLPIIFFPDRFTKSKLRKTEEGPEKQCTVCSEWWPADSEFFYPIQRKGGYTLRGRCRSCEQERKRIERETNPHEWQLEIVRKRHRRGTFVIVTYNGGRHYAAIYPPGANTDRSAICQDLKKRRYGRRRGFFRSYDLSANRYLPRWKSLDSLLTPQVSAKRRSPSAVHPWRLANDASYRLHQARIEARRKKGGDQ